MPGKYDHLTNEQLIALLEAREQERRLGLVWERDPAHVGRDESINQHFVTLSYEPGSSCQSAISTGNGERRRVEFVS